MKKSIMLLAVTLISLMGITAVFADGPGYGRGGRRGFGPGCSEGREFGPRGKAGLFMLEKIGVDAKRKDAIIKIMFEARNEADKIRIDIRAKRFAMKDAFLAGDEDKIRKGSKEIFQMKEKIFNLMLDARLKTLKILTPEERAKFLEFRRKGFDGPRGFDQERRKEGPRKGKRS